MARAMLGARRRRLTVTPPEWQAEVASETDAFRYFLSNVAASKNS